MEPKTGKRIVSKGAYVRLIGKKIGYGLFAVALFLCVVVSFPIVRIMFRSGTSLLKSGTSPLWAMWYLFSGCAAVYGFYRFLSVAKKKMNEALRKENVVPLTRANTADLPAPDSLVRASEQPLQAQEGVLLRAAAEGVSTPSEQLVRASVGQE